MNCDLLIPSLSSFLWGLEVFVISYLEIDILNRILHANDNHEGLIIFLRIIKQATNLQFQFIYDNEIKDVLKQIFISSINYKKDGPLAFSVPCFYEIAKRFNSDPHFFQQVQLVHEVLQGQKSSNTTLNVLAIQFGKLYCTTLDENELKNALVEIFLNADLTYMKKFNLAHFSSFSAGYVLAKVTQSKFLHINAENQEERNWQREQIEIYADKYLDSNGLSVVDYSYSDSDLANVWECWCIILLTLFVYFSCFSGLLLTCFIYWLNRNIFLFILSLSAYVLLIFPFMLCLEHFITSMAGLWIGNRLDRIRLQRIIYMIKQRCPILRKFPRSLL